MGCIFSNPRLNTTRQPRARRRSKGSFRLGPKEPKPTWTNTSPFIPPITRGLVIKVYDGDTLTVASKIPGLKGDKTFRFNVRLAGINAPELRGDEKEAGIVSRDRLRELVMDRTVELRDTGSEKYGRLLSTVYLGEQNICQTLLDERLAVEYMV